MYRKIIERLKEWKTSDDRKPLVLLGARQVGKTWLMKEFGQTCYDSMAYLNCDNEPLAKDLFNADYNIPRILLAIQAITGVKVEPGRTLIVIDEIQEAQRGLHSLKYFCENAPESIRGCRSVQAVPSRLRTLWPVSRCPRQSGADKQQHLQGI